MESSAINRNSEVVCRNDLVRCNILDTPSEAPYNNIVYTASQVFHAPMCSISFVDDKRQWFKSEVGLRISETGRKHAFYTDALQPNQSLIIYDALSDRQFCTNLFVRGPPHIRFYAGSAIYGPSGQCIGRLNVMDRIPRHFYSSDIELLALLADDVSKLLDTRSNGGSPGFP
jgi:GAF domain-containing protein